MPDGQFAGFKAVVEDEEDEGHAMVIPLQEALAAAVTNLKVTEGNETPTPVGAPITDAQVTKAAETARGLAVYARKKKPGRRNNNMIKARTALPPAQATLGTAGGSRVFPVPPIQDCLPSDCSILAELQGGAKKTATAFVKKKQQVIGKRAMSEDTSMEDASQPFLIRFKAGGEKRPKGTDSSGQEVEQKEEKTGEEKEATSTGAAGHLAGAEDRACQEP
jgi:hypothetical protein